MKTKKVSLGGVTATVVTVLICFAMLVFVGLLMMTIGSEYGFFDIDDVLFDGISHAGSGSSDYEKTVSLLQLISFGVLLILGGGMLAALHFAKKKGSISGCGGLICCACLLWSTLLFCFLTLLLYDFQGFARIILLLLLPILCVGAVMLSIIAGKRIGIGSLALTVLGLAVGFWVSMLLTSLIGSLLVIFGDVVWVLALLLAFTGTCGGTRVIYIIRI